jgi:nucleoside-diphosphate-sugar epimerase
VLVTGASGFTGSRLADRLHQGGARVCGISRTPPADAPHVQWHRGSMSDVAFLRDVVASTRPSWVFHASTARAPDSRQAFFETNVVGANALITACTDRVDRLVVLGSSSELGRHTAPLAEHMAPRPHTLHGATKAAATMLFHEAANSGTLPAIVVRPFSVYGPGEPASRLVSTAITAGLTGGDFHLTDAGFRRDWVYVDDIVEGCLRAAVSPASGIVHLGTGVQTRNEALLEIIDELTNRRMTVHPGSFPPRPMDSEHWVADTSHCEATLGWKPSTSLRDGLTQTLAHRLAQ